MANPSNIPARTSSKRAFEPYTAADALQKMQLTKEINRHRKSHTPTLSTDADFFAETSAHLEKLIKRVELSRKECISGFLTDDPDATVDEWREEERAKALEEEETTLALEARICRQEAERRRIDNEDQATRRTFMQMYTMSPQGLGISEQDAGMGRGDPTIQSDFRKRLIEAMNIAINETNELWCPVLHGWLAPQAITAAHIYPYSNGQNSMHGIFGLLDRQELNSIENGMMISTEVETMISAGSIAIVPNIPDPPTLTEVNEWHKKDPKPYKVRVIDRDAKYMDKLYPGQMNLPEGERKKFRDLDNRPLIFRSSHRPRARYLYWQYCTTMLRKAWRTPKERRANQLKQEIKRPYWGTKGPFMKKAMLRAFVEEMGHEYEDLLDGAIEEETTEKDKVDPLALVASSMAIRAKLREGNEEDDDDEEEEDDDDEDETSLG